MRRAVRLPLDQLQPWLLDIAGESTPLDFRNRFGNANPVEMEIGFGKGLFLLTASARCPEINFLGIEIECKYTLYTATRLAKRNRQNVRLVCADARTFLPSFILDSAFHAVHIYFPDPWWKNRHRKRRLFTEDFARQCARVLKSGGQLHFVSDVQEYFDLVSGMLGRMPEYELMPPPDVKNPEHDLDYLTNFDRKYRKEGKPIYRARYRRT
jgi:tRNA (guanine-N7-)-methyltransferase